MAHLLSILIASLQCRQALLDRLVDRLTPQWIDVASRIEIVVESDNGQATIGEKRNRLLDRSRGAYVCFIDDDDLVATDYIPRILDALANQPDCVGFRSSRFQDDQFIGNCSYTMTHASEGETPTADHWEFRRWPNHLCPIRRELALSVRFNPWCYGEDRDYAIRVRPLLKHEAFIDSDMYRYLLRTADHRQHEIVHPNRWRDNNFRVEKSFAAAARTS